MGRTGASPRIRAGPARRVWRRESFYFAHLVFSLHYHTFLLLFWTAYIGLGIIAAHAPFQSFLDFALKLSLLAPPVYLYLALRRVYGDGPKQAVARTLVLGSMHLLTILLGLTVVGVTAFLKATM